MNKQQSRVMLRRARRVMVDIETALLTGPPTVQPGISSDEQANQLLSKNRFVDDVFNLFSVGGICVYFPHLSRGVPSMIIGVYA